MGGKGGDGPGDRDAAEQLELNLPPVQHKLRGKQTMAKKKKAKKKTK
jgi:hypothetical protein